MQIYSAAILLGLLTVIAVACQAQQQSPCNYVRCGYGSRCELDENDQPRCVCPTICPKNFMPICGSDNRTYGNTCEMNVKACKSKKKITKLHDGECDTQSSTFVPPLPTRISPGIGLPKFKCSKPKAGKNQLISENQDDSLN